MTCNETEQRLSAYLEKLLPPEEAEAVRKHLAVCARCRRAAEQLEKVQGIVSGLPEVEPPPFFEERIMARVREEAAQKPGLLRKLFYPLHIKIPVQAFATLLVAVIAFSVFRTVEPEVQHPLPPPVTATQPAQDRTEAGARRDAQAPAAVTPPAGSPAAKTAQAVSGDRQAERRTKMATPAQRPTLSVRADKQQSDAVTSETARKAEAGGFAASPREPAPAPQDAVPAFKITKKDTLPPEPAMTEKNRREPAPQAAAPTVAVREKEALPLQTEALRRPQTIAGTPDRERAAEHAVRESAQKGRALRMDAAVAPPPEGRQAGVSPPLDMTLHVTDIEAALQRLKAELDRADGRITGQRRGPRSAWLEAEIGPGQLGAFLKRLEKLGRLKIATGPAAGGDPLRIRMEIILLP